VQERRTDGAADVKKISRMLADAKKSFTRRFRLTAFSGAFPRIEKNR